MLYFCSVVFNKLLYSKLLSIGNYYQSHCDIIVYNVTNLDYYRRLRTNNGDSSTCVGNNLDKLFRRVS